MKKKVALIIHGWSTPEGKDRPIHKFLLDQKYRVIAPNLFEMKKEFNLENVIEYLESKIGNRSLDLIVGVSMGGLIAPHIAQRYPKAKLVFLASGPFIKLELPTYNTLIKIINSPIGHILASLIKVMPKKVALYFHHFIVPRVKGEDGEEYIKNAEINLKSLTTLSYKQIKEVIKFTKVSDTRKTLPKLQNKSLILAGKKDRFMPFELSRLLHKLLPNSELVVHSISHLNVFNDITKKDFVEFLRD